MRTLYTTIFTVLPGRSKFLLTALLLLAVSSVSRASNTAPTFTTTTNQLIACQNATTNIDALMAANDPDASQTETWTVINVPANGTLAGFPATASTGAGGNVAVNGTTYTPNTGYTGGDVFIIQISDGNGGTATIVINVEVMAPPSLVLGANPAIHAGVTSTSISYSSLSNAGPTTAIISYTGALQKWVVPPGVTALDFDILGGGGGGDNHSGAPIPGKGGRVTGTLTVTPGQLLNLYVGGKGGDGTATGAVGGFNGGGDATFYFFGSGGAGGGASDIRIGGTSLANRKIVAGGGAGNGWDSPGAFAGGHGGGTTGQSSPPNVGNGAAGGGTPSAGGAGAVYTGWPSGAAGTFGLGGDGSTQGISGGGGGGWYGGGGGCWNGGGGGSSYTDPLITTSIQHMQGYNDTDGKMTFNYTIPATYTIQWNALAHNAGFTDVTTAAITPLAIPITVPASAPIGDYHGTLTIANDLCTSTQYPITVVLYWPTGINNLNSTAGMNIYPNPNTGNFTLSVPQLSSTTAQLLITNITGEKVYSSALTKTTQQINISAPAGLYFIQLRDGEQVYHTKMIIQ